MRHFPQRRDLLGLGFLAGAIARAQSLTGGSTAPPGTGTGGLSAGASFATNRTAIIDALGKVGAVAGSPTNCVLADGTSAPCDASGSSGNYSSSEAPGQTSTLEYTLAYAPSPAASLQLFMNGLLMMQNVDYALSGNTITFSGYYSTLLATTQMMAAFYQYAS